MDRCTLCNARIITTSSGKRCMNPACPPEGVSAVAQLEAEIPCPHCDTPTIFKSLNTYGEPIYQCNGCGQNHKL